MEFPSLTTAVTAILRRHLSETPHAEVVERLALDIAKRLAPQAACPSITVAAAVDEFLALKRAEGCRPATIVAYRKILRRVRTEIGNRPLAELAPLAIAAFVHRCSHPTTRRAIWLVLHRFVQWAAVVHPIPADLLPASARPRLLVSDRARIYTPAEAEAILRRTAQTDEIGYWILALFSGLRTAEIVRLSRHPSPWSLVRPEAELIDVPPDMAKRRFRVIPMLPVLRRWLIWLRPQNRSFYPPHGRKKIARTKREVLGSTCARIACQNIARRSYISYRFGLPGATYHAVAAAAGNTEATIRKFYRRPVSPAAAATYFSLGPERCA